MQKTQKNELYPVTVKYDENKIFPSNSFFLFVKKVFIIYVVEI